MSSRIVLANSSVAFEQRLRHLQETVQNEMNRSREETTVGARMAREEIGRRLGPHYAALAALLGTYRSRMMKMVPTGKERAKTWKRILASHVPELIREGDRRGAAAEVKRQIAEAAGEEKRR